MNNISFKEEKRPCKILLFAILWSALQNDNRILTSKKLVYLNPTSYTILENI